MPETPLDETRPGRTRPDETAPDRSAHAVSTSSLAAAREVRAVFSRPRRRLRDSTDTRGLTPSQTSVIGRLDKQGPASVATLAARERVRHQSMAATVGVLEERGLVERRPDPEDGRSRLISLTADGRSLLEDRRRGRRGVADPHARRPLHRGRAAGGARRHGGAGPGDGVVTAPAGRWAAAFRRGGRLRGGAAPDPAPSAWPDTGPDTGTGQAAGQGTRSKPRSTGGCSRRWSSGRCSTPSTRRSWPSRWCRSAPRSARRPRKRRGWCRRCTWRPR
ncbi:MarR family winged helix-turn-helix transcriptional regulator [Yinghuangia aomiensis]